MGDFVKEMTELGESANKIFSKHLDGPLARLSDVIEKDTRRDLAIVLKGEREDVDAPKLKELPVYSIEGHDFYRGVNQGAKEFYELWCGNERGYFEQSFPRFKDGVLFGYKGMDFSTMSTIMWSDDIKYGEIEHKALNCRGYEFNPNTIHVDYERIRICKEGFHFCPRAYDIWSYKDMMTKQFGILSRGPRYAVVPVVAVGSMETTGLYSEHNNAWINGGFPSSSCYIPDKVVTDALFVGRPLMYQAALCVMVSDLLQDLATPDFWYMGQQVPELVNRLLCDSSFFEPACAKFAHYFWLHDARWHVHIAFDGRPLIGARHRLKALEVVLNKLEDVAAHLMEHQEDIYISNDEIIELGGVII